VIIDIPVVQMVLAVAPANGAAYLNTREDGAFDHYGPGNAGLDATLPLR
jgi:hypothetical protein